MSLIVNVIHAIAFVLLICAAILAVARMALGPSSLDRCIAMDVLMAICVATTGCVIVMRGTSTALPVLVVLSILGFTGPVAIARLISSRSAQVRDLRRGSKRGASNPPTRATPALHAAAMTSPTQHSWDDSEDSDDEDTSGRGQR